jgi:thiol-disulfide isomerase/thioredoxin
MKKLILLALGLTAATTTDAQLLNVPKNKQFEFVVKNAQHGSFKSEEQFTYAFRSLGKNTAGNNVFECKLVKAILKQGKEDLPLLNTDSIYNTTFNSTSVLFPLAILNERFSVTVSPKGKVLGVEGLQPVLKAAVSQWKLQPEIEKQLTDNAKGFISTIQGFFLQFPEQKIAVHPEWVDKDSGIKFKLAGNKSKSQVINSYKKDTSGYSIQGKYAFDPVTGLILNSQTETKYAEKNEAGLTEKYTGGGNSSQKISNNITKAQTDTSWVNMAVKFSYWSNALKNELGYDSLKVNIALKANEKKFGNDRYYMVSKLGMIQQMRTEHSYKVYDSLLLLTPNKYLEGTHHLSNKMYGALNKGGAKAAYDVSKYFYKTDLFNDWVQHTLAQDFLSDDDTPNPRMGKAYELLTLFMMDKDPLYQQKTKPLYLWAMAEQHQKNPVLLVKNAMEYTKMGDVQMHKGNGARYALLLYKLLLNAKTPTEADSLLNHIIKKLEKYTADPSNSSRYAEQNMLAYAWYLKYRATLGTDSSKAFQYLAKAADYSPKAKSEKAHSSFYDRVFLKSKESYRDEYMNALLKGGNETEAMQVFALHISVNPENLSEMQKLYKTRFPDKDFKSFMVNNVVSNWKTAPDFKLKKIDGKEQSLSDFKDKWLVIDFWGTWCGPCKEELPEVNKFYLELENGKHGNTNFLSIACSDKEEHVKAFISSNKYSIPVAMSDNKVERDYKISGYPSKILVSPEGKMLNIDFGKDWKKILKQLNSIYAIN